jgi:hypothetical protein
VAEFAAALRIARIQTKKLESEIAIASAFDVKERGRDLSRSGVNAGGARVRLGDRRETAFGLDVSEGGLSEQRMDAVDVAFRKRRNERAVLLQFAHHLANVRPTRITSDDPNVDRFQDRERLEHGAEHRRKAREDPFDEDRVDRRT